MRSLVGKTERGAVARDHADAQVVPAPRGTCRAVPQPWVYLLRCRGGSLYTGWAVDLERRLARHRFGAAGRVAVELALATYTISTAVHLAKALHHP
jgi:hypothetical protein